MPAAEQFAIGAEVSCTDGACGKLSRVVVDPVARVVTHLIVEPHRGHEPARLVPLDLADSAAGEIQLNCTSAEFGALDPAEPRPVMAAFARPKSISLAPFLVSMTFPGFKSR